MLYLHPKAWKSANYQQEPAVFDFQINQFCRKIRGKLAIEFGRKTVQEILVANDLRTINQDQKTPVLSQYLSSNPQ